MKRDMDLVRKMVLALEDHPDGSAPAMRLDGYTDAQIGYHAYLLVDSGLATGSEVTTFGSSGPEYILTALTSAGHDFADSARNQYVWDEVMADIKKKGFVSAAIDMVKKMLDAQIRKQLSVE